MKSTLGFEGVSAMAKEAPNPMKSDRTYVERLFVRTLELVSIFRMFVEFDTLFITEIECQLSFIRVCLWGSSH